MSKLSECSECNRAGWACICPDSVEVDPPVCKDKGGLVGNNGECLLCTAEAGEVCR